MPFIRVTRTCDKVVIDINTDSILQFYPSSGNTRIDLKDNISHDIVDEPRQLRGYIKKAEGTLPEKAEPNVEVVISGMDPIGNLPASRQRV